MCKLLSLQLLVLVLLLLSSCGLQNNHQNETQASISSSDVAAQTNTTEISVTYDLISRPIKDDNGNIIAVISFNKPVLSGDTEAIAKINEYFSYECEGFFDGSNKSDHFANGDYDHFYNSVQVARHQIDNEALITEPLIDKITCEVMYSSSDIISIKESKYWLAGGVADNVYYGATFDLKTGNIMTLENFLKVDSDEFNREVVDLLCNFYQENDSYYDRSQIADKYKNFSFNDYEYIYDGTNIFLLFTEDEYINDGYIIMYN